MADLGEQTCDQPRPLQGYVVDGAHPALDLNLLDVWQGYEELLACVRHVAVGPTLAQHHPERTGVQCEVINWVVVQKPIEHGHVALHADTRPRQTLVVDAVGSPQCLAIFFVPDHAGLGLDQRPKVTFGNA